VLSNRVYSPNTHNLELHGGILVLCHGPGRCGSSRVSGSVTGWRWGVLTATFPRLLVGNVIDVPGRREQRNRLLPAHLV
jgi:Insertion element 4 transposase N-terminal